MQTIDKLKPLLADALKIDEGKILPVSSLKNDLGADSLDLVDVVMRIEEEFGVNVADEDVEKLATVQDIATYLDER